MPKVGNVHYSYSKKGRAAARAARKTARKAKRNNNKK